MQRKRAGLRSLALCGAVLVAGFSAANRLLAQTVVPLQTTVSGSLQSLASRAAIIFSGQVISIEHRAGVVEITFRVEQPVLGAVGTSFVLREWAGLWPAGQFRYNVGERALVFVHATSAAGFASPVNGQEGVVPVVVQGADAPALLDVRRIAAGLQRAVGAPLATEAEGAIQLSDAITLINTAIQASSSGSGARPELPRLPLPSHGPTFVSPRSGVGTLVTPVEEERLLRANRAVPSHGAEASYAVR